MKATFEYIEKNSLKMKIKYLEVYVDLKGVC